MTTRPPPGPQLDHCAPPPAPAPVTVRPTGSIPTSAVQPVPGLVTGTGRMDGDPLGRPAAADERADRARTAGPTAILRRLAQGAAIADPAVDRPAPQAGLPARLRANVEALSGISLADVTVHYGSTRPAALAALAYTRGSEIFLGPGQERHLPHEAWHAVQQARGPVRTMTRAAGLGVNDDERLEREADVMGARARSARSGSSLAPRAPRAEAPPDHRDAPVQMVKQPPVGNFPRYVNAMVSNSGVTANVHPNDAEVAAEGDFTHASLPANSYGWANLQPNNYGLIGAGGGANTQINIDPMVDVNGNHLYRMHLVHHRLGANTNANVNNIVLGPHAFNLFHVNHVENFMGDSMNDNFYTSANGTSMHVALVGGEATGIAPPAHANAGVPYVVGNPPVFPAGLLTGNVLAANNGVPGNAHEITTDEQTLDRFVTLWYLVRPVFGLVAGTVYNNLLAALNNHYMNSRPGAVKWGEGLPGGILGPGGMLQNIADALAGIYATSLVVQGSFFTPEPGAIPAGGGTANLLPWRDNRFPTRTLANAQPNPHVWIQMTYLQGGGFMANSAPVTVQI